MHCALALIWKRFLRKVCFKIPTLGTSPSNGWSRARGLATAECNSSLLACDKCGAGVHPCIARQGAQQPAMASVLSHPVTADKVHAWWSRWNHAFQPRPFATAGSLLMHPRCSSNISSRSGVTVQSQHRLRGWHAAGNTSSRLRSWGQVPTARAIEHLHIPPTERLASHNADRRVQAGEAESF